jgi:hypothetical protein
LVLFYVKSTTPVERMMSLPTQDEPFGGATDIWRRGGKGVLVRRNGPTSALYERGTDRHNEEIAMTPIGEGALI